MDHSTEGSAVPLVSLGFAQSVNWPLQACEADEMPPLRGNTNDMREDIGEIRGTLTAMQQFLRENREERAQREKELEQRLSSDIRSSREDARQSNTQVSLQLERVIKQSSNLEDRTSDIAGEVLRVKKQVGELTEAHALVQTDVASLKALKDGIVRHVMVVTTLVAVVWALIGPVVQGWIKGLLGR